MIKQNSRLAPNDKVVQAQGHIASDMDGEKVMLSVQKGKYYNLGSIGGIIWDRIGSPIRIGQLIEELELEYEVGHEECELQVVSFLDTLFQEGLIEVVKPDEESA